MSSSRSAPVKVALRVRPLSREEQRDERFGCVHASVDRKRVSIRSSEGTHHFDFDRVFDEKSSQSTVFQKVVAPLVSDFMMGRNCCVLCYGDRGSGKTYTMMGPSPADDDDDVDDDLSSLHSGGVSRTQLDARSVSENSLQPPQQILAGRAVKSTSDEAGFDEENGIIPRTAHEIYSLFRKRRKRGGSEKDDPKLKISYVEVHKEKIVDLLHRGKFEDDDVSLSVRSNPDQGVYIESATTITCRNEADFNKAIEKGQSLRTERNTRLNTDTTKAHAIIILKMERYSRSRGKMATSNLFLVDMANSALAKKPPSDASDDFYRECKSIRKSLSAVRKCLRTLAEGSRRSVPYGESIFTKLMHDALSKGSGIWMIVTTSPMSRDATESLSAMKFGTYVSGRKEEAPEPPKKQPQPKRSGTRSKSNLFEPELLDENTPDDSQSLAERSQKSLQKTYQELDAAGKLLNLLPEAPGVGPTGDPIRELSHVSDLLESAAKRMEADLIDAKQELKNSGFRESLSATEMEQQLLEVTKELSSMKYDGQLASQIQRDLAAAQAEFDRLQQTQDDESELRQLAAAENDDEEEIDRGRSVVQNKKKTERPRKESVLVEEERAPEPIELNDEPLPAESKTPSRTRSKASLEIERLRQELAEHKKRNEELKKITSNQEDEIKKAQKTLEELERQKMSQLDNSGEAPPTQNLDDNDIAPNSVHMVDEEVEDPWDEPHPDIEIGPCPVKVCLRLRPMTKLERNRRSKNCIEVHDGNREFTVDSPIDGEYDFCFDNVFDVDCNQEDVYETVGVSIVEHIMAGINCAVMVYGLTGSGKTHTLAGKLPELKDEDSSDSSDDDSSTDTDHVPSEEDAGFSPRLIDDLFRSMKDAPSTIEFRITCSYVCIYLEKMFDLLDPRFDKGLIVRDAANGIRIEGAVEAFCFTAEDIIHLIRRGAACRKLIGSKLKIDHNRSHSILLLNIEQRHVQSGSIRRSYLHLAELAGFEVTSKAKGQSVQETKIIHKSFSALGNVIKSLTEGNKYAPYRESKLTSILKDALGGNCKSTLFITASPSSYNISETINSIRLGQRVRRVTNDCMVNLDASMEDYRKWLLQSEMRLGVLSKNMKEIATDLYETSIEDPSIKDGFSTAIWESVEEIAEAEESVLNPCRKSLLIEDAIYSNEEEIPYWRNLSSELAKIVPSDKTLDAMNDRDKAESLLTDIQSESVVLRRQNELLVQEKRKMEDEVSNAHRENRKITMQNSELEHKLALAENRSREATIFLKYMRTLCWKLQKDVDKDRPIQISEITNSLQGSPDLSGLVDLDSMMMEAAFLQTRETDIEQVEADYFDYLQEAGLIIDEEQAAAEEEIDELAGLDDELLGSEGGENNRWNKAKSAQYARHTARAERYHDSFPDDASRATTTTENTNANTNLLGGMFGWTTTADPAPAEDGNQVNENQGLNHRNTRRERELLRDIQNMSNKCVELTIDLHNKKTLMESFTGKTNSIKMKSLAKESTILAKERDRMMHNAKAATWKLQELHVVNKLLSKQSSEHKEQVRYLEEGFQRLQESFRGTVQDGLDADQHLRERVKTLQGIVDSLTGPVKDDDSIGSDEMNPLNVRVHLPIRGRRAPRDAIGTTFIDPSSEKSEVRCLVLQHRGKRVKKFPSSCCHHAAKHGRKSKKTGTALIGNRRKEKERKFKEGKELILPLFLDDEDSYSSEESFESEGYEDD